MTAKLTSKNRVVILFNPMPVKHTATTPDKRTTSIQVPLINVPLSLLAIGRMVRDEFNVNIINAVVDSDYEEQVLKTAENALCLAVSSMTCHQIRDGINVCASVKEHYPALPVIWGGYHPSTEPLQTLKNPNIDIVIRGQGERTFREVLAKLSNEASLNGVPGVSFKEGERFVNNPDRKFEDINVFPPVPYEMIDVERHVKGYKFGTRCLDYYASQGCSSGCDFCSEPIFCGRRWSGLRPGTVVSELEYLAKTYNIDTFMVRDSDFFLNVRRLKELCRLLIEKDAGIRLTSVNGRMEQLSRMDDSIWALFRRAGIHEIFIGFESGYQDALDAMNKGAKVEQIRECINKCIKHDIDIRGSFMVGIPGVDAEKEVGRTLNEIHGIISAYGKRERLAHMDILLSFFTPYPNTPLYKTALENGLPPLNSLEDWGDFDQFDFKAPWFPQEYFDIVRDFRDGLPSNSRCGFDEWCGFYERVLERL